MVTEILVQKIKIALFQLISAKNAEIVDFAEIKWYIYRIMCGD